MGRVKNQVAVYFFMSKKDGIRKTWFFPSKLAADKWLKQQCHAYINSPSLEAHLALHSPSRHKKETEIYERHKEKWHDFILRRASIVYK